MVGKMNDFGDDLAGMQEAPARRPAPRDLDLELGGLGGRRAGAARRSPPPPIPGAPRARRRRSRPRVSRRRPRPSGRSTTCPRRRPAAKPQARPRRARGGARPGALRPPARCEAARRSVALQLEIEGLSGELQRVVEALLGKVIELPPLRIRVKSDDLG